MAAVATRPISHVVTDDKGKVVRTITFAKGDVIHDDDLHEILKDHHHHSLSPVPHTNHYRKPESQLTHSPGRGVNEVKS